MSRITHALHGSLAPWPFEVGLLLSVVPHREPPLYRLPRKLQDVALRLSQTRKDGYRQREWKALQRTKVEASTKRSIVKYSHQSPWTQLQLHAKSWRRSCKLV